MMKGRFCLLLLVVGLLLACGRNREKSLRLTPEEQVETIYAELLPLYLADALPDLADAERKYCTQEWNSLRAQEQAITDDSGEIGVIDCDPWLSAQDWDSDLALRSVERFREISDDTVWVKACLTNCGEQNDIWLVMTYEDGQWRVDDFPCLFENEWQSLKASLQQFIEEE